MFWSLKRLGLMQTIVFEMPIQMWANRRRTCLSGATMADRDRLRHRSIELVDQWFLQKRLTSEENLLCQPINCFYQYYSQPQCVNIFPYTIQSRISAIFLCPICNYSTHLLCHTKIISVSSLSSKINWGYFDNKRCWC